MFKNVSAKEVSFVLYLFFKTMSVLEGKIKSLHTEYICFGVEIPYPFETFIKSTTLVFSAKGTQRPSGSVKRYVYGCTLNMH